MSRLSELKARHDRLSRQSKLSAATGAAGLLGLGAIGTSAIIRRPHLAKPSYVANKAKAFKKPSMPDLSTDAKRIAFADNMKDKGYIAGSVAGGIGGVSALNFARNQSKDAQEIQKSIEGDRVNRTRALAVGSTAGGGLMLGLAGKSMYSRHKNLSGNRVIGRAGAAAYRVLPKSKKKKIRAKAITHITRGNIAPATAGAALLGGGIYLSQRRKSNSFKPYDGYFDLA